MSIPSIPISCESFIIEMCLTLSNAFFEVNKGCINILLQLYVSFGYGSHDKDYVSCALVFSKAKLLPADLIVNYFFHSELKYADKNFSYVTHKAD